GGAAVLAALDRQRRCGEGAYIDLAQLEAGVQFLAGAVVDHAANGVVAQRNGNRDAVALPHGCYRCKNDEWCVLSCWDEEEWQRLCTAFAAEEWRSDVRF